MSDPDHGSFQDRVVSAAEAVLKREGSVGVLGLLQQMGFLHLVHVEAWRKGNDFYPTLEPWIQVGDGKFSKTIHHFTEWVRRRGLHAIEVSYTYRSPSGIQQLQITESGDPEQEKFYRTHFAPRNLPPAKAARLKEKLNKAPELVVFQKVSEDGQCSECGANLGQGDLLVKEKDQPLCLTCADLDHLVFLSSGDTALTRRARKHSSLSAVVVRFSRARKRYDRQGLLVTEEALAKAEAECAADAPDRAAARARAAESRRANDHDFVDALTEAILTQYPACPRNDARRIAQHTGQRNSGRVGRSAAGRAFDPRAIDLAVIASVRHNHTEYDELLMKGTDRMEARLLVRGKIDELLARWSARPQYST
jgi:hypothetical protein